MHLSVLGTIVMDKMNVLPGEGTADDPQALLRDPVGWRAAVFGRLGTAVKKTFMRLCQLTSPEAMETRKFAPSHRNVASA